MPPLMSIIIPLYIVEAYIVNCMNSFQFNKKCFQFTLKNSLGGFYE